MVEYLEWVKKNDNEINTLMPVAVAAPVNIDSAKSESISATDPVLVTYTVDFAPPCRLLYSSF